MLLSLTLLYILVHLPYSVFYVLKQTFGFVVPELIFISQSSLSFLIIFKILFFYYLSKGFRNACLSLTKGISSSSLRSLSCKRSGRRRLRVQREARQAYSTDKAAQVALHRKNKSRTNSEKEAQEV